MRETPDSLPDRPSGLDSSLDVVGEVLGAVHLTTAVFGRLELGAPWRLRVPARGYLSFYVVARGRGGVGGGGAAGSDAPPLDFDYAACPHVWIGESARFGGDGPVTTLVAGNFTFGGTASRNPLLSSLPALVHLPAGAAVSPQLGGVVPLILSESATPGRR